jgi:tetratricopeptide (TPR) repeat protein
MAAKRDLTSAWSHEVKVSVPDAGISLGEISTLLKARFGHDLHIGGDLVDAGEGRLALTVRGDGVRAKTFTGKSDELNQLIVAAVSNVLGVLASMGDEEGAWRAGEELKRLAGGPDLPAVYYSWGLALDKHGDLDGAVAKLLEANRCGPHWADPLKAWGDVLMKQAHIKEALAKYDEALKYAPTWERLKEARAAAAKRVPT